MTLLLVEPHDPLIFRDGRPFNPTPGVRATSHAFPMPSTTAGAVRTMLGTDDQGRFDTQQLQELLAMRIRGPLLGELQPNGRVAWMAPAPADALLLADGPQQNEDTPAAVCKQLLPIEAPAGCASDLTANGQPSLQLVGPRRHSPAKALSNAPRYWYWRQYEGWLLRSGALDGRQDSDAGDLPIRSVDDLGHNGPEGEQRMHVGIDPLTQTAEESMLFQTRGLAFQRRHGPPGAQRVARLVLALDVSMKKRSLPEQVAPLGGERRLARWSPDPKKVRLPVAPEPLIAAIVAARACRIVLLTPAWWERGYYPTWLCREDSGVRPELVAVATGRPLVHSGWDYARRQPKPARRLAPAGTVVFLRLKGGDDAIRKWVERRWLHSASDEASPHEGEAAMAASQWQLDGFGLAAVGLWCGVPAKLGLE